jgi:hypothetical protein
LIPRGWLTWWDMVCACTASEMRVKQIYIATRRQEHFKQRIQPNLMLAGWLEWWRMAESKAVTEMNLSKAKLKKILYKERIEPNLLLDGWKAWWDRIQLETDSLRRERKITKAAQSKIAFQERTAPNLLLSGWRSWWSRMEAEGRREAKSSGRLDKTIVANRNVMNGQKKAEFISKFFSGQAKTHTQNMTHNRTDRLESLVVKARMENVLQDGKPVSLKCGQITPKRKNCDSQPGSEKKKRKLSPKFQQKLNFWKQVDKQTHTQAVPTNPAVRFFGPKFGKSKSGGNSAVVIIQGDGPGGDKKISNIQPNI